MPKAVECELYLYADDSCLVFQHKNVKSIENQLNKDFSNICDWFVDNKLSIHFGDDKTKSILFASKNKVKKLEKLNIIYNGINIKQHSKVNYLGCELDETLSGESMGLKILNKVNSKLKFLYRKNKFLNPSLRWLLCNALIQPHFDYACSAWLPNLSKKLKNRLQASQNKCIRFCLQLGNRSHINYDEFERINWLSIEDRFNQCICASIFKFFNKTCPSYMEEVYDPAPSNCINTRSSVLKLNKPSRKTVQGQKSISFIGPSVWNALPDNIKQTTNVNSFKHNVKKHYLKKFKKRHDDIYT